MASIHVPLPVARLVALVLIAGLSAATGAEARSTIPEPSAASTTYDWLQFGGDAQHDSDNTVETIISPSNVGTLQMIFQSHLSKAADNAPVYLTDVTTPGGVRDLLFVTTRGGELVALDAHTGAQVWTRRHAPGPCKIPGGGACYTTASPAIDPNRLFVYTHGLDGFVHKHRVGTGREITTGGWPELVTLEPNEEKGSSSLSVATARDGRTYLYSLTSSFGDNGEYHGHVTAINLTDPTHPQKVFNALCSDQTVHFVDAPGTPGCGENAAGIWGRGGPMYDSTSDHIFLATGNGPWDPASHMWGESDLALNPDGTGVDGGPVDSYTPTNWQHLVKGDHDLGGTNPVPVSMPSGSVYQHVAVQGAKDGFLRLLNLDNLSGMGGPGQVGGEIALVPMPGHLGEARGVRSEPAAWVNPSDDTSWVFVDNQNGLVGFQVTVNQFGSPTLSQIWNHDTSVCLCKFPDGNSPLVANGVLYVANPEDIQALDPTTGHLLWHDTRIGAVHWSSPVVVNGVLYVTDLEGGVTAYAPVKSGRPAAGRLEPQSASPSPSDEHEVLPPELTPEELWWQQEPTFS